MQFTDTIFALSSGRLPSGIAVVRISGPSVRFVVETVAGAVPTPARLVLRTLRAADGSPIDTGFVAFFSGPASFTGEDSGEFHIHGGRAVVDALLRRLGSIRGVRPAEAGEFTRRAFLNGKFDLVQAEALGDLIEAETEAQRRLALEAATGHVSRIYDGWRSAILRVQAAIAADLDFSDEGDVPDSVAKQVSQDVAKVRVEVERHLAAFHRAEMIRDGYRVVIVGPPNAGKSSLLNALAGRDVAIVADEPGTTRDLIEVPLDLGGLKIVVTDTAGIRPEAGYVERMGIERAVASAEKADLVIELVPYDDVATSQERGWRNVICIRSKVDKGVAVPEDPLLGISTVTGEGIERLLQTIRDRADADVRVGEDSGPQKLRHRAALERCAAGLARAEIDGLALELVAEELRVAAGELGRVTGRIDVEDILGEVFSAFCIGK